MKPAGAQVYEDHHLSSSARATAWQELVDWVIWLHDAYELSTEERLPECWPQHPGLIRELAALRAWRLEIYTPPADATTGKPAPVWGNGGSARAWHAELRNVVHAAQTFYARGCRVGHKPASQHLTGNDETRTAWLDAQPPPLLPHGLTPPADGPASHREISGQAMRDLISSGTARTLSPALPGYAQHQGTWWVAHPKGTWLQITDPALATRLDQAGSAWDASQPPATRSRPYDAVARDQR